MTIGLKWLENDIKNMSENYVENKKFNYLKDLVTKIVDANKKLDNMTPLKTKESATERQ